jgi:hypothetical protein
MLKKLSPSFSFVGAPEWMLLAAVVSPLSAAAADQLGGPDLLLLFLLLRVLQHAQGEKG